MKLLPLAKATRFRAVLTCLFLLFACYYFFVYSSVKNTTIRTSGSYVAFESAEDLYKAADLVVSGFTNQSFEQRKKTVTTFLTTNAIQDFYTTTEFRTEYVFKGNLPHGTTIQVGEPVSYHQSLTGQSKITREDYSELKKSSNYLLFLKKNSEGLYFIMNAEFGKYNTDHTDADDEKYAPKQKFREQMIQDKTYASLKLDR
ncbi:hypothetical protein [Paenibacillus chitinolyticus]|uniref:hypothetical protein n=1 Tax=Paenibacillus chitinolyticus TaxID=79263 RepID=UPI001C473045|nr:hypothetical protein [Paenibacillus chitinolyticus]MBV6716150.1 hypothetical protein [Paenibacillus chitinolyticus]